MLSAKRLAIAKHQTGVPARVVKAFVLAAHRPHIPLKIQLTVRYPHHPVCPYGQGTLFPNGGPRQLGQF